MEDVGKNSVHLTKWDIFVYLVCGGYFITTDNIIGFLGKISLILVFIVGPVIFIFSLFDKFQKYRKWAKYAMVGGYVLFLICMALIIVMIFLKSVWTLWFS
ncbi:hypothetical protein [Ligilactobacillus ceti]|uniref:hypothetical protein n=1 Tax=Ligilactobacillus ceti TaxID=395085 RepID=UPI0004822D04|nr:hypothetical protein [Ligilactobacillus ceti]